MKAGIMKNKKGYRKNEKKGNELRKIIKIKKEGSVEKRNTKERERTSEGKRS